MKAAAVAWQPEDEMHETLRSLTWRSLRTVSAAFIAVKLECQLAKAQRGKSEKADRPARLGKACQFQFRVQYWPANALDITLSTLPLRPQQ